MNPRPRSTSTSTKTDFKSIISQKRRLVDEPSDDEQVSQRPSKVIRISTPLLDVTNSEAVTAGSPAAHHESAYLELSRARGALDIQVLLQHYSNNHIDVSVQLDDSQEWWRFTGFYGEPDTSKRELSWNLLSRLHDQSSRAWLCAGDFNEILDQSEKYGGSLRPTWQIRNFRAALDKCALSDLGFTGPPFTWCNRHSEPTTLRERLDRACANMEWTRTFPDVSVRHEPMTCSDHTALIIRLTDTPVFTRKAARPWRFEALGYNRSYVRRW
ncbi:UNVERIFIED_CONTAM: hypothetical protein Slati_4272500 [Sesamum latifolium]|uniref:Endonuclease/exonuclease/phosphatase domain-containing protein n=1 Tax=Sesamum latifolium TaxID=2727402 RepID=A0AAW2TCG2_9LAMI